MTWTTLLAGLPANVAYRTTQDLLLYLLLLGIADWSMGARVARLISRSKVLYLPRSGYQRWCRYLLGNTCLAPLPVLTAALLLSLPRTADSPGSVVLAALLLYCNIITLGSIQTLIIAASEDAMKGFFPLLTVQLLSVMVSHRLPGAWKLLLPGNWGMALRCTLSDPDGYPLAAALLLEAVLLGVLWTQGGRLLRRFARKEG